MREPLFSIRYVCVIAMLLLPASAFTETRLVRAGDDLQAAINAAQPGDVILLEPGAVFVGEFVLPAKSNPAGAYITIRSAAPDSSLPAPGQRITPASASALPVIRSSTGLMGLTVPPGASYYRLESLEFQANVGGTSDIIRIGSPTETDPAVQPHHIVMDRIYVHGHPTDGQRNGLGAHGRHITLVNSYISDIKLVGVETHAFISYNGPGPYRLENNYLEASGINVLFGGANPTNAAMTPADITIRGNHIAKNTAWMTPRADGRYWTVKNLFELKVGVRVLIEGNVIENNWYGAGDQAGYAVLMRTENQGGACTWCETGHVTFRYNSVRRSPAGLSLIGLDYPAGGTPLGVRMHDVLFHDNLFVEIDRVAWRVGSISTNAKFGLLNGVDRLTLDHNTLVMPSQEGVTWFGGSTKSLGFTYTNNMSEHKLYGFKGDGTSIGTGTLNAYTAGYLFAANVVAGGSASAYPIGNMFPTVTNWQAEFVDYAGGNYRLKATSIYAAAATDGRPLGADIDAIEAATQPGEPTNQAPIAVPGGPYAAPTLTAIAFDGGGSTDPDGTILSYVWNWGDGSPDSPGVQASHQYPQAGSYTVTLTVTDNGGASAAATTTATVGNRTPTAEAGGPYAGTPGVAIAVAATGSTDVDGTIASYQWSWGDGSPNTTATSPTASHVYSAAGEYAVVLTVTDDQGAKATDTATVSVVSAGATPPPASESVIYTAELPSSAIHGAWQRMPDGSAAGGAKLATPNGGWSTTAAPLVTPSDYFEATFDARADTDYRVWLRLSATGNSKWNDAVWVQFSDAVTRSGAALYRIGTTGGLLVNLATTSAATELNGWGWQNTAYWLSQTTVVRFASSGTHTMRVQVREDGVNVDQIVLSPARYLTSAPGPLANDQTIVAKSLTDIVVYGADVTTLSGAWRCSSDPSAAAGTRLSTVNAGWATTAAPLAAPTHYFDITVQAQANLDYRVWLRLNALDNNKYNDAVWVQFSDAQAGGTRRYQIGTTDALMVNLATTAQATSLNGWGWQNTAYWLSQPTVVRFATTGPHTIRVQVREDGVSWDQLVLSPSRYFNAAPGPVGGDTKIVTKP